MDCRPVPGLPIDSVWPMDKLWVDLYHVSVLSPCQNDIKDGELLLCVALLAAVTALVHWRTAGSSASHLPLLQEGSRRSGVVGSSYVQQYALRGPLCMDGASKAAQKCPTGK